ncbi:MAG: GlsB/YeaQ/YmgE family stress response membrane protein [Actinomyces urogenitalis]|uniref:Transglycosylase associated protein n=4 Tax=Actinomyces urogenitalis TaxID=103621 RepID=C0W5R1_9ACTO|nr:GlsB/YeaQ/YmgE family stress response membrane protein [Actinomyces urogenitalis]MDY3949966.1 GlsB/YeaQ/YmgE family stress response membrane protein [Eggerthella lenta]EEH65907.1 hypothetical protein HMPREF0058_1205 [Actinomyces urogenitalis DSM 15434]KGF01545.1 transglycosylase [Actinomyces urogenitalis S6-C4]MBS5977630.1 GlsB/YeaQ/YmgE family stress response membrane protein [Actinomyces urogenitalis]MBS6072707.1 GlsB/YeaQ/YmgE family stress response membrane protein [Actinomyces urogenit
MFELIGMLVFGGVIGALARLVMKGEQDLSIVWTIILGAIGAFLGGSIAGLLGVAQTPGIDWIRWIVSVVCAVGVISVFETVTGRKK